MTRYLISFDDGAMTFPDEDLPAVAKAAHEVVEQAKDAGVWVTGGGVIGDEVSVVGTDGSVSAGQSAVEKTFIGGFSIVDLREARARALTAYRAASRTR